MRRGYEAPDDLVRAVAEDPAMRPYHARELLGHVARRMIESGRLVDGVEVEPGPLPDGADGLELYTDIAPDEAGEDGTVAWTWPTLPVVVTCWRPAELGARRFGRWLRSAS